MLASYARTQRMIDSLSLVQSRLNLKLNIADTAAMLAPYSTVAGSTAGLNTKVNISDTASMLSSYARTQRMIDSLNLVQNRLNLKLNIADTASMLAPYATVAGSTAGLNTKLNISDTASMLSSYARTQRMIDSLSLVQGRLNLKLNIADTAAMLAPYVKSTGNITGNAQNVAGIVAIANGGTGSATKNFVDITSAQTIAGTKTFSSQIIASGMNSSGNINVNGVKVGTPEGSQNTMLGSGTFAYAGSIGNNNTAVGNFAFTSSAGNSNTAIGSNAIRQGNGGSGDYNTAVGESALSNAQAGSKNTGVGVNTLNATTGSDNVSLGYVAGRIVTTGTQNTFLGSNADAQTGSEAIINSTAIGYNAKVASDNTIQLGNANVTAVNTSANVTANAFIKSGGTSSQYLMADGSVSAGAATINDATDEFTATATQTSFTLTQTPSTHSKVKMYINGIRISNSAYSWSGKTLTYVPANNGSYTLTASDRIQFDYFY
jgi:hypothetical protein